MLFSRFVPLIAPAILLVWMLPSVQAGEIAVQVIEKTEQKAVFGQVSSRDVVPARARLGGTIVSLQVDEGSAVKAGDLMALVVDDKLALQLDAIDARLKAIGAELQNAESELERAKKLLSTGVVAKNRVDTLQTQVDVLTNQLTATRAERAVLVQQGTEGQVIAPATGRVLSVPVTKGSVVMPGETIARIASGGYFLRLSLPERHAARIHEGDAVMVGPRGIALESADTTAARQGKLVKVFPEIESGHVLADVEVDGLGDFFVGERTLVWIPVEKRLAFAVPLAAISNHNGVDYVQLVASAGAMAVPVIIGETFDDGQGPLVEVLSGLSDGDKVIIP